MKNKEQVIKDLRKITYGGHSCEDCKIGSKKGDDRCSLTGCKIASNAITYIEEQENISNIERAPFSKLQEKVEDLELTIAGIMLSVDKWLEGDELDKDEVNRAIRMREKTLEIVEGLVRENRSLMSRIHVLEKYDEERDIALHARLIRDTREKTAKEIVEFLYRRSRALEEVFKDPNSAQCFRGRFELENAAEIIANDYYRVKKEGKDGQG